MDFFKYKVFIFAVLVCFLVGYNCSVDDGSDLDSDNDCYGDTEYKGVDASDGKSDYFTLYNNCIKSIASLFRIKIKLPEGKETICCPDGMADLNIKTCVKNAIKYLKEESSSPDNDDKESEKDLRLRIKMAMTKKSQSIKKLLMKQRKTRDIKEETKPQESSDKGKTSDIKEETKPQESSDKDLYHGKLYYKALVNDLDPSGIPSPTDFCKSRKKGCTKQLKEFADHIQGPLNYALYNIFIDDFESDPELKNNKTENFKLQYMEEIIEKVKLKNGHTEPTDFCDTTVEAKLET